MGPGRGKTEHAGPRDMGRKHGHWGFIEEAKEWATRARRRDERDQLRKEMDQFPLGQDEEASPIADFGAWEPATP